VIEGYERGVNFFFVTADLHWPLYEGVRQGLRQLLEGNKSRRDEIVVAVVSYLDNPLFGSLQFHEVINQIPGLERVDVLVAGAIPGQESFQSRLTSLAGARQSRHNGARAIGASFHQRTLAAWNDAYNLLDVSFIRYNAAHPGARADLFPYLNPVRTTPSASPPDTGSPRPPIITASHLLARNWMGSCAPRRRPRNCGSYFRLWIRARYLRRRSSI
jgi:hypothetical protein